MHRCTLAAAGEGAPAGAVLWTAGGLVAGTAALPPEIVAAFVHGAVYEVRVAATSHAGLTAEAAADFTVDLTPPTIAPLRVASAGGGGSGACAATAFLGQKRGSRKYMRRLTRS